MEYLDLYDEFRKPIGETILRSKNMKKEKGKYINIVIVFIQNSEGKFLIQMTSKRKGSIFATTGGLVKSGSSPNQTIVEEIKEELGLDVSIEELELVFTEKREYVFQDVYYLKKDVDINSLTLQESEVEYVLWLSVEEIKELIKEGKFREGNITAFERIINEKN